MSSKLAVLCLLLIPETPVQSSLALWLRSQHHPAFTAHTTTKKRCRMSSFEVDTKVSLGTETLANKICVKSNLQYDMRNLLQCYVYRYYNCVDLCAWEHHIL